MQTIIKTAKYQLTPESEEQVREKLGAVTKLLGADGDQAMLEVEVTEAPAEGRSSEPYRLVARLSVGGEVYHAEAVKPSPESAADRVRSELESEIRKSRGKTRALWRRGKNAIKEMLRFS